MSDSILQVNQIKDKGGNATGITVADSTANVTIGNLTATLSTTSTVPATIGGSMHLLSNATLSSSAAAEFTSLGNYSSFKDLHFVFRGLIAATDNTDFFARVAISGTSYLTSGYMSSGMRSYGDNSSESHDNWQTSGAAMRHRYVGNDGEISGHADLFGFNNTTHKKQMVSHVTLRTYSNYIQNTTTSGFYDSGSDGTNAITAIKFFMGSGNIASGQITMYGIKNA